MTRLLALIAIGIGLPASAGAAQFTPRGIPYVVDPVTARIYSYCRSEPRCIRRQHQGIQLFLAEITSPPPPGNDVVQRCMRRAARSKGRVTDWHVAAHCLR